MRRSGWIISVCLLFWRFCKNLEKMICNDTYQDIYEENPALTTLMLLKGNTIIEQSIYLTTKCLHFDHCLPDFYWWLWQKTLSLGSALESSLIVRDEKRFAGRPFRCNNASSSPVKRVKTWVWPSVQISTTSGRKIWLSSENNTYLWSFGHNRKARYHEKMYNTNFLSMFGTIAK